MTDSYHPNEYTTRHRVVFFFLMFCILTLLWGAWMELGPGLGGIVLRPDASGVRRFRLRGLAGFWTSALSEKLLWRLDMWDINPIIFIGGGMGIMIVVSDLLLPSIYERVKIQHTTGLV